MPTRLSSTVASAVEVEVFDEPLPGIRQALAGADDALLGVAFVQQRGVNLIERQLKDLGGGRLVTTTVFGSTTHRGSRPPRRAGCRCGC